VTSEPSAPRWGICFGPAWGSSIAELTAAARRAEQRGFDRIAVGEYHNDALAWLQALAGATSSIRVATTIVNIALRHPSVTAEAVAGIRDLHGDRIELGLGVSHRRIVGEQLGLDLPGLDDLSEYAAAVRAVLEGGPIARTRVCAGPVPILAATLGLRAAARAAAYADGLILTWTPHRQIAGIAQVSREAALASSRPVPALWVVLPCLLAAGVERSRRVAAAHLRGYLELPAYRRMLEEAGFAAEIGRVAGVAADDSDALVDALSERLLTEVAECGGREGFAATRQRLQQLGVTDVILYPLDAGDGWRAALNRTLDELAPGA
jgi:alkanesulfonate monooxygenase SsuD/methylene tetrahydromethanopterin reductase-like flavin-dependent oxidoreductase (luciferase family)